MSFNSAKSDSFLLQGTQVNITPRNLQKERKNSKNSKMSSRPFSASPQNSKREKNVAFKLRRPLSADTIFCDDNDFAKNSTEIMDGESYKDTVPSRDSNPEIALPSSQILQSLLSEPIGRWRNENANFSENYIQHYESNSSDSDSDKSLGAKIEEITQRSVSDSGILVPGIKTKPPIPEKKGKKLESLHLNIYSSGDNEDNFGEYRNGENECFIEDLEDADERISNTSFRNWLQDSKNLTLETKILETQTDLNLQNVHKHHEDLTETILNIELYDEKEANSPKRTTKNKTPEPQIKSKPKTNKTMLYRTEFTKTKKLPKETTKKPPKSILKPQNNKKQSQAMTQNTDVCEKKEEDCQLDNVNSWISSNAKHESFLEFLNKLDDLDNVDNEELSRPTSQRSFLQDVPVQDGNKKVPSTCDEIEDILEVLEKEDLKSQKSIESYKEILNTELMENQNFKQISPNLETSSSSSCSLASSTNYTEFLSYLDEVDKSCMKTIQTAKDRVKCVAKVTNAVLNVDNVPKLEDLINFTPVELSHYVVDLSLRLKEKSSGILTLQTEISKLNKMFASKSEDYEKTLKQKLKQQKDEYEPVLKRHQKFIDQLIADKKSLNQQCESLINEMKVLEDRYNTNMRALEQRHKVELQKAKDMHMAAEKLRREKWIEGKTQKIKEMTVKGLEPELQNMASRHQQEISDLRTLHKKELEDIELKAARKTQQQCEALRQQLTLEREQAIGHERDILRQRLEKLVESEEKSYQELRRRLSSEHSARLSELDDRISQITAEKDRAIESAKIEFDDKLQTAQRRHKTEMKNLRESMDLEMEVWKNNFKKQQNIKMAEVEGQMREACKKERDREIETVIERLEKEADEMKGQIEQAADNRLRRMKEKYEEEIKDLEAINAEYKTKYSETKEKLMTSEDNLLNLKSSMKQLQAQYQQAKQMIEELSMDKNKIREQIKEEFIKEIKSLEDEVKVLKNNREDEMQKIFAKVKLTVNHKDELLSELTRNNTNLQEKCKLLENLLEQQRKEFLIK